MKTLINRRLLLSNILYALVLCCLAAVLACCSSIPSFSGSSPTAKGFGGGSISNQEGNLQQVSYITGKGSLIGENGLPLAGAEVNAQTKFGNELVTTDSQGRFQFNLPVGSNENVKFSITSGKSSGEVSSKGFGVGVDVVLFHFKVLRNGKVVELKPKAS